MPTKKEETVTLSPEELAQIVEKAIEARFGSVVEEIESVRRTAQRGLDLANMRVGEQKSGSRFRKQSWQPVPRFQDGQPVKIVDPQKSVLSNFAARIYDAPIWAAGRSEWKYWVHIAPHIDSTGRRRPGETDSCLESHLQPS